MLFHEKDGQGPKEEIMMIRAGVILFAAASLADGLMTTEQGLTENAHSTLFVLPTYTNNKSNHDLDDLKLSSRGNLLINGQPTSKARTTHPGILKNGKKKQTNNRTKKQVRFNSAPEVIYQNSEHRLSFKDDQRRVSFQPQISKSPIGQPANFGNNEINDFLDLTRKRFDRSVQQSAPKIVSAQDSVSTGNFFKNLKDSLEVTRNRFEKKKAKKAVGTSYVQ